MEAAAAPGEASHAGPRATATTTTTTTNTYTPDGLRQRQRDRLSPRGRYATSTRAKNLSARDARAGPRNEAMTAPQQRANPITAAAERLPEALGKKQRQDGLRKENSVNRRAQRDAEDVKYDITPDGSSAGREGRQFTVAKVGNNGRIYLRPTIRPANQRYPQPPFVFPNTPPSTAGLDTLAVRDDGGDSQRDSLWTPTRTPTTIPGAQQNTYFTTGTTSKPQGRHKRSLSYSTIEEQHVSAEDVEAGAFKVIIERPGTGQKLDEGFHGIPTLEVPIPSYKLGTPRFSTRGTAFLRSSLLTATDDVRSSIFTQHDPSHRDPSSRRPTRILSRRHSDASPQPQYDSMPSPSPVDSASLPPSMFTRQRIIIRPEMFDDLTFKPNCDHPSVVRYSRDGTIRAATPPRLVAEITSPSFVDYDLLSDFFLTFRGFLETTDLLYMLIARLKWALSRDDETGTVVRVRTFVAIRHWILNYFLDDYVVDYDLRKSFCDLLNNFGNDLPQNATSTKIPLKILGELKKCWRRLCALYWDGPEFDPDTGSDVPIQPGGVAGSRNPELDASFWQTRPDGPPRLDGIIEPDFIDHNTTVVDGRNFFADVSRAGHAGYMAEPPRSAPATYDGERTEPPLSPTSIMSEDFVSCSFPHRARTAAGPYPVGAHPVVASSLYDNGPSVAMTPKALTGKRVRPTHAHKRSGSFSDSFRDQRPQQQPVQKVLYKSTEILLALPYAGSLVRGNMFPPGQAFVDVVAPSTPAEVNRATTFFPGLPGDQKGPSAMSGPGMKRLLGSVRRALSTRHTPSPNASPTHGSFPHIPPLGVRGATINRLPGTAIVPQARSRNVGARTPMRIDLLGAEIAEDFKRAVQEDSAAAESEAEKQDTLDQASTQETEKYPILHYSEMAPDETMELSQPPMSRALLSGVTAGSKSIVIVDDTMPSDLPQMAGALPVNPSVDTFADAYLQPSGGPTPPSTPPQLPLGTPRRSSHLLGQNTRNRSFSFEATPSLVVGSSPSKEDERSPSHRPIARPSLRSRGGSFRVKKSVSLRRYASYHSGYTRHRSERSFDATTFSESEDIDGMSHVQALPLPLRPLRRRPGGDLRAVNNVGDLHAIPLPRPQSTGSFTTYSDSLRSSYLLADPNDYPDQTHDSYAEQPGKAQRFSLGALAENSQQNRVSLFSTHSSQPVMRPSFEKEAKFLAQIPDDINDDGGVESALLKLEGKYEQRDSGLSEALNQSQDVTGRGTSFGVVAHEVSTLTLEEDDEGKRRHRHEHIVEKAAANPGQSVQTYQPQQQRTTEELKPTVYIPQGMQPKSQLLASRSVESYNSIPLLDRGLTDDEHDSRADHNWSERSIFREPSNERPVRDMLTPSSSHPNSFDFIEDTDSIRRVKNGPSHDEGMSVTQSFLDDASDTSDLSSELSLEVISRSEFAQNDSYFGQAFPPMSNATGTKDFALPSHPLQHPPSPTVALSQPLKAVHKPSNLSRIQSRQQGQGIEPLPPSPETTPTGPVPTAGFGTARGASPSVDPLRSHGITEPSRKTSVHLPFILAFDSQILAQQFTLIEKDALNEIDWKDMIEMRWKDRGNTDSRSWVEFLRTSEPHGVEVVIARFNLMVKWAVSEIVLTQDISERVRCIIKYIHIAAQCRKYRNFATMTQITVALTSKDVARLTKTWAHVPATDLQTLRELEALVTPTSNFHNLRAEMEGSGADQGCIPFVGIYTHDLLVNSERPSQIASTPTTEPLTNFERCRMDASIVKNLLRLLEASQLYRFLPIEGVTERCLWMAALSDEEISKYGNAIQE